MWSDDDDFEDLCASLARSLNIIPAMRVTNAFGWHDRGRLLEFSSRLDTAAQIAQAQSLGQALGAVFKVASGQARRSVKADFAALLAAREARMHLRYPEPERSFPFGDNDVMPRPGR